MTDLRATIWCANVAIVLSVGMTVYAFGWLHGLIAFLMVVMGAAVGFLSALEDEDA